jgi:hypothetical protein
MKKRAKGREGKMIIRIIRKENKMKITRRYGAHEDAK